MLIKSLEQGGMQQLHFAELPPDRHRELLARMAFLVTRGSLPDRAYHTANDGMVHDEMEEDTAHGIDWDVVKAVADAWPDPARGPDARPVYGVFQLAGNLVGLVEATIEVPETLESNLDQLMGLCLTARMRKMVAQLFESELARRNPAPPEPAGDGADEGAPDDGWANDPARFDDDDAFPPY